MQKPNMVVLVTWGPPMINFPDGCRWKTVRSSRYLEGMTALMTFSMRSLRSFSRVTSSSCCAEMTTVCTWMGMAAPLMYLYSTVTCSTKSQGRHKLSHSSSAISPTVMDLWAVQSFLNNYWLWTSFGQFYTISPTIWEWISGGVYVPCIYLHARWELP